VCRALNNIVVKILSRHTGHSDAKIRRDISRPKYFSPADAVDYNLIDRVLEPENREARARVSARQPVHTGA
jgi:ATP-dependent protease ClpP protease subunit